jgi:2-methylcitrate dehydratase
MSFISCDLRTWRGRVVLSPRCRRGAVGGFRTAHDIAGGGTFGDKSEARTEEQVDNNLMYLTAAALIDDEVGPQQLREDRIRSQGVQDLLRRGEVRCDDVLTAGCLGTTRVRVHIDLSGGARLSREQSDFEGARTRRLSWQREVEKFHGLSEPYADPARREDIVSLGEELDAQPVGELTALLARVSPTPLHPRSRRFV